MNDFPYPEIQPFERLQVSDGLMINSERWRLAHGYHQRRQNVQYQSLFLPGIICGLEVVPIAAPEELPSKFRDGRWVQIQPGIAIDLNGNFIVIPTPLDFRVSTEAYSPRIEIVYIVISYVDPAKLKRASQNELLVETFRINEKNNPPVETEIEICRIAIAEELLEIKKPINVFAPNISELDMRYRLQAKTRPQKSIQIACFNDSDSKQTETQHNIWCLGQSLTSLAPTMSMLEPIGNLDINAELALNNLKPYHLIYLTGAQAIALSKSSQLALQQYIASGGAVLIESSIRNTKLGNLLEIQVELKNAILSLKKTSTYQFNKQNNTNSSNQSDIQAELQSELDAIAIEIKSCTDDLLDAFLGQIIQEKSMLSFSQLERIHPIRSQPFLFSSLPEINEQALQIVINDGVIVIFGDFTELWGGQSERELPRETIRTSQELGINILNYAEQRYAIANSMQINPKYIKTSNPETDTEQRRITNMTDKPV